MISLRLATALRHTGARATAAPALGSGQIRWKNTKRNARPNSSAAQPKKSDSPEPMAPAIHTDDFPYARIPETQFDKWSESTSPLQLRAFFAQHRPLMAMSQKASSEPPRTAQDPRDVVYVHVWEPQSNFLSEPGLKRVPQAIANDLGPFDVAAAARGPHVDTNTAANSPSFMSRGANGMNAHMPMIDMPPHVQETLSMLGSFLNRYNNGTSGTTLRGTNSAGRGTLAHVSFVDGEPYVELEEAETEETDYQATSVRRKRKLKMNRHKYRKRLKEQRTQRRRLGK